MMEYGQLSDYFVGVSVKRLSAVDAEPCRSNQHEIGTTRNMRDLFLESAEKTRFQTVFVWLSGTEDSLIVHGNSTHYDARKNQRHRPAEWRLYYPTNSVTEAMSEGDSLFLAKDRRNRLYFIVAPRGTTSERQLCWLFGTGPSGSAFTARSMAAEERKLGFSERFILECLGIELDESETERLDESIGKFGLTFPSTREFSAFVRRDLPETGAEKDPDDALIRWLTHEEALFRRLERRIVSQRLQEGFVKGSGVDVDAFLRFSLSVQNRRKSRMGYSLENHLETIFKTFNVAYVRGARTEHNHRPDFLFPSSEAYWAAPARGSCRLSMLGAKSTCKERWRQVLAEAEKITRKHLLTLEPGISEQQTAQMQAANLQLVVPLSIQESYTGSQRKWLWSLGEFIQHVQAR